MRRRVWKEDSLSRNARSSRSRVGVTAVVNLCALVGLLGMFFVEKKRKKLRVRMPFYKDGGRPKKLERNPYFLAPSKVETRVRS